MELLNIETFFRKLASIIAVLLVTIVIFAFVDSLKTVPTIDTTIANAERIDSLELSIPIVDNSLVFCDETVSGDDIEFMLEFIASTESQGHRFMPTDSSVRARAWKQKNPNSTAIGKWQMLKGTRAICAKYLGEPMPSDHKFLNDTAMQTRFILAYIEICYNKFKEMPKMKNNVVVRDSKGQVIRYDAFEKYVGKVIGGCYITKSGMLVLAHSIGTLGAIQWIESGCKPSKLPQGAPIAMYGLTCQVF
jgi:hypothetical protein